VIQCDDSPVEFESGSAEPVTELDKPVPAGSAATVSPAGHGILFFNHGRKHLERLLVSLWSLRKHWQGPAILVDTDSAGSRDVVAALAADARLAVKVIRVPFQERPKNSCYVMKSGLWRHSPFDITLQIDSDTAFAGSPQPLFDLLAVDDKNADLIVTQFSDWVTTGPTIRGRLNRWRDVVCPARNEWESTIDIQRQLKRSLATDWPAINTGVVGYRGEPDFLTDWERVSIAGWKCPFTDELAAQLLVRQHPHLVLGDRWNCSPIHGREKADAVIWHFHGGKERRPEAAPIWEPLREECERKDVGGVREWGREPVA